MRPIVILVHGINDTHQKMNKLHAYLTAKNRKVLAIDLLPCNGDATLEKLAQQLDFFIKKNTHISDKIDLIGYSMGGLVARYYVENLKKNVTVEHFITLATPHKGTLTAYFSTKPGIIQMRPNSIFIREINATNKHLKLIKFTSIWSPLDLMILPSTSSLIGLGNEVIVWALCHPQIVKINKTFQIIEKALSK